MKLEIESSQETTKLEPVVKLRLEYGGNGTIVVKDDQGWNLVGFRTNGTLVRYTSVGNKNFRRDWVNRIALEGE